MVTATEIQAKFAPKAKDNYVKAFQLGQTLFDKHEINNPLRLAHFMAQIMHESGGLRVWIEDGRYTEKNLAQQWDAGNWHDYFASREECIKMAEQCKIDKGVTLFNLVYSGRMGNGPPASGDGWKYRGRGLMQTTGRDSYKRYGKQAGVDFVTEPDLVLDPAHALKPALGEWTHRNLNAAADANDIKVITKAINNGYNGLDDRKAWFAKIWAYVSGGAPIEQSVEWRVQEALTKAGFDTNGIDGVIGADTRSAILAFRTAKGLPGPPTITKDLLLALGLPPG